MKKILSLSLLAFVLFNCKNAPIPSKVQNIYLIGDSTVKNGYGDGRDGLWGWGDHLYRFIDTSKVKITNSALGGTSSKSFFYKGLWQPVLNKLSKGDILFIQFGHNDSGAINDTIRARGTLKGTGNEFVDIVNLISGESQRVHTYGWHIRKYVKEAKSKGAIPIVVSPIPRNNWNNDKVIRNNENYGLWAKQVASEESVDFIDLNELVAQEMESKGKSKVTGHYFYKRDHTHTTIYGAIKIAQIIVENLKDKFSISVREEYNSSIPLKRNLFMIGDSTMADNNNPNAEGWGIPFEKLIDTIRINYFNMARGGRSSRTFIKEGLWDSIVKKIRPNDFVFIQFGHNDAGNIDKPKFRGSLKGIGEDTLTVNIENKKELVHTFGWYLTKMVKEVKQKGGIAIVSSITVRNVWNSPTNIEQRDLTYNLWAKEIADKELISFVDHSNNIAKYFELIGQDNTSLFFPKDHTHTNLDGATVNALQAYKAIIDSKNELRNYFNVSKEELSFLNKFKSK